MLKNLMNKKNKKKGFTLIELIIVVAIIAILAAVAVPKYLEVREKSNVKGDISNAKVLHAAVVSLIADGKIAVPTSSQDVEFDPSKNTGTEGTTALPAEVTDQDNFVTTVLTQLDAANLKAKAKGYVGDNFVVRVNNDGNIVIVVDQDGELQVYPDNGEATNKYSDQFTGGYLD